MIARGPRISLLSTPTARVCGFRNGFEGTSCPGRTSRIPGLSVPILHIVRSRFYSEISRLLGCWSSCDAGLSRRFFRAKDLGARANEFLADKKLPENFDLLLDPGYTFTNMYDFGWDAGAGNAYPSTFSSIHRALYFSENRQGNGGAPRRQKSWKPCRSQGVKVISPQERVIFIRPPKMAPGATPIFWRRFSGGNRRETTHVGSRSSGRPD